MRKYPYSLGTEGLVHATQHDIKRINMNSLFFIEVVNLDYSQSECFKVTWTKFIILHAVSLRERGEL
jgi:hypothetical protein